ncbi:MAG TPA: DHH family phosphoesterase [Tepidisphaeraceae bacterium]|jgi:nanoRNase/pAp phosphatase (c-di-AMP/oligoRNAs hydrolase)|nr:DHH family phosphoesterase [Tepidisphaeraceae bacterium]
MTAFVESCVGTVADSAGALERRAKGKHRAEKLLRLLAGKKNILVTAHQHPDPDALASTVALARLLEMSLHDVKITITFKGRVGGGLNEAFVKYSNLKWHPWDEQSLSAYDAILLLDTQPAFQFSPLPVGIVPFAVIDHHRSRHGTPHCPFTDIRTDVGATSSIIFSYFMELELPIKPDLGATLLFGIESDLAGAAGAPGELDNIALSGLTLIADARKLYQMRYVDLPQSYYTAYASALANAYFYDSALMSHLDTIDSMEKPAVLADFLLRFDQVQWALVSAIYEGRLMLSLRTSSTKASAADIMRRLTKNLGEGGGHRSKAGGAIKLETGSATEIERIRMMLRRRYLRALKIPLTRGQKLVPRPHDQPPTVLPAPLAGRAEQR